MTAERKRTMLIIGATLIIGIVIGSLASGLWGRRYYGQRHERGRNEMKMDFEQKILKVVDADAQQIIVLEPILKETLAHVDSLQHKTDKEVRILLDSLDNKLKNVLREEQFEKFKKFISKGKNSQRHR